MTQPHDGTPADDQPTSTAPADAEPSNATRPIPQDQTAAIPSAYTYPAAPPRADHAAEGTPLIDEPAPRGRRRTGLVIGTVSALATLGTGAVLAYNALSGGGVQPADVLPQDAYAYLRIDIDPSAGQKIAAVRFLNTIPQIRDLGTGDARKALWELATKDADNECVATFRFDEDIAPWLGERAGVALRPGGTTDDPNFALALGVTDEAKASDTLTRLFACDDGNQPDLRMKDGYALVTLRGTGDDLLAAVDQGTLADNATFTSDMDALGEQGVLSFWGDLQPMLKDATTLAPDAAADAGFNADEVKGRFAAALRFDPGFIELAGIGRGIEGAGTLSPAPGGDSTALATLPEGTMAAVHVANGDQMLDAAWPQLKKQLDGLAAADGQDDVLALIEDQLGIKLPDDLKAIVGSSFTFAMPEQGFDEDVPTLGFKVVSRDAARADEVLTTVEDVAGSSLLVKQVDGDHLYVATTRDYVAQLKGDGKLGDSDAFGAALGDLGSSQMAYFLDLDKLEKLYLEEADGDARAALEAMRAVGGKLSATAEGESSFTLRVIAN